MEKFTIETDAQLWALEELVLKIAADVAAAQPEGFTARLIDRADEGARDIDDEGSPANIRQASLGKLPLQVRAHGALP